MDVRWTAHPARRRPQDIFLVAGVILISSWAVMVTLDSPWLALCAAVFLLLSVTPFLAPTHYRLDDDGLEERRLFGTRRRAWSDMRRRQIGNGAALVSPFARPSFLDRRRGMYLYLDGAPREQVIAILEEKIPCPASESSSERLRTAGADVARRPGDLSSGARPEGGGR